MVGSVFSLEYSFIRAQHDEFCDATQFSLLCAKHSVPVKMFTSAAAKSFRKEVLHGNNNNKKIEDWSMFREYVFKQHCVKSK